MTADDGRELEALALLSRINLAASAAAVVSVREDGTLTVACSCGEPLTHPSGRPVYTLQRLTAHMDLHVTAAARRVPWDEVRRGLDRLTQQRRPAPLLPVERAPRDDDPGE